jgi:hypothetical protein
MLSAHSGRLTRHAERRQEMRNRIDITNVKFRVQGVGPRQVSRNDKTQKRTPPSDGNRPIWTVRLNGKTTDQIFVEVAGDMPQLAIDEFATVTNLTYQPWAAADQVNGQWKGKIMRAYRADSIAMADASARRAA